MKNFLDRERSALKYSSLIGLSIGLIIIVVWFFLNPSSKMVQAESGSLIVAALFATTVGCVTGVKSILRLRNGTDGHAVQYGAGVYGGIIGSLILGLSFVVIHWHEVDLLDKLILSAIHGGGASIGAYLLGAIIIAIVGLPIKLFGVKTNSDEYADFIITTITTISTSIAVMFLWVTMMLGNF